MTSQALSEGQESNLVERGVAALKEMGSLPVTLLRELVSHFQILDNPVSARPLKLRTLSVIAITALLLAACGSFFEGKTLVPEAYGEPQAMRDQRYEQSLPPAGQMEVGEVVGQQGVAAPVAVEQSAPEKEYQPAYAVVQPGEGVIDALRRASGAEPHQVSPEEIIEILHGGDPSTPDDDWVEVYNWPALLRLNPRVDVGDQIKDTLTPYLSVVYKVASENMHIDK